MSIRPVEKRVYKQKPLEYVLAVGVANRGNAKDIATPPRRTESVDAVFDDDRMSAELLSVILSTVSCMDIRSVMATNTKVRTLASGDGFWVWLGRLRGLDPNEFDLDSPYLSFMLSCAENERLIMQKQERLNEKLRTAVFCKRWVDAIALILAGAEATIVANARGLTLLDFVKMPYGIAKAQPDRYQLCALIVDRGGIYSENHRPSEFDLRTFAKHAFLDLDFGKIGHLTRVSSPGYAFEISVMKDEDQLVKALVGEVDVPISKLENLKAAMCVLEYYAVRAVVIPYINAYGVDADYGVLRERVLAVSANEEEADGFLEKAWKVNMDELKKKATKEALEEKQRLRAAEAEELKRTREVEDETNKRAVEAAVKDRESEREKRDQETLELIKQGRSDMAEKLEAERERKSRMTPTSVVDRAQRSAKALMKAMSRGKTQ